MNSHGHCAAPPPPFSAMWASAVAAARTAHVIITLHEAGHSSEALLLGAGTGASTMCSL
jgi:hypothetical protein